MQGERFRAGRHTQFFAERAALPERVQCARPRSGALRRPATGSALALSARRPGPPPRGHVAVSRGRSRPRRSRRVRSAGAVEREPRADPTPIPRMAGLEAVVLRRAPRLDARQQNRRPDRQRRRPRIDRHPVSDRGVDPERGRHRGRTTRFWSARSGRAARMPLSTARRLIEALRGSCSGHSNSRTVSRGRRRPGVVSKRSRRMKLLRTGKSGLRDGPAIVAKGDPAKQPRLKAALGASIGRGLGLEHGGVSSYAGACWTQCTTRGKLLHTWIRPSGERTAAWVLYEARE